MANNLLSKDDDKIWVSEHPSPHYFIFEKVNGS